MAGFQIFKQFQEKEYIHEKDFKGLVNYICANIQSDYSPNCWYYQRMYRYCSKLCIVKDWRKRNNLPPVAKYGKMICYNEKTLIKFFEDLSHEECCGRAA